MENIKDKTIDLINKYDDYLISNTYTSTHTVEDLLREKCEKQRCVLEYIAKGLYDILNEIE